MSFRRDSMLFFHRSRNPSLFRRCCELTLRVGFGLQTALLIRFHRETPLLISLRREPPLLIRLCCETILLACFGRETPLLFCLCEQLRVVRLCLNPALFRALGCDPLFLFCLCQESPQFVGFGCNSPVFFLFGGKSQRLFRVNLRLRAGVCDLASVLLLKRAIRGGQFRIGP